MSVTPKEEREAQEWIESISGRSFDGSFAESLKDGIILCKLANKLKPGSVPKINEPATMPFKKMENITSYLKAVRALGMKEFEMFGTPDLYDEKNIPQVISSIHALGRLVQAIFPEGTFPKLGIKVVEKNERHFTEDQLREARAAVSVLNLGSSDLGKKAFQDVLEGKPALTSVLGEPSKTPLKSPPPVSAATAQSTPATATKASPAPKLKLADIPKEPAATPAVTSSRSTSSKPSPATSTTKPASVEYTHSQSSVTGGEPATNELPPGWEAATTDDGRTYYYNTTTRQTTWEKPTSMPTVSLPPGWDTAKTEDGRVYYYNTEKGLTTWELPTGDSETAALPVGWEKATTDDGKVYYYNTEKNITQWERPTA